jgi:hypothetical protein
MAGFIHFRHRVLRCTWDERSAMFPPFLHFLFVDISASVRFGFERKQKLRHVFFQLCLFEVLFRSTIYNIRVRVVSDIQTLAFGSNLYIRFNTAAHVVNSTSKTH